VAEEKKPDVETKAVVCLPAPEAYEDGMGGMGVRHDFAGGVCLSDLALIEDDSPGAGCTSEYVNEAERSPLIPVGPASFLKKILVVNRPQCRDAVLYILSPGSAVVEFNGVILQTKPDCPYAPVPPDLIRKGDNEVVVRAEKENATQVKLALRRHILENNPELADRPCRSFRSYDAGKTWEVLDGELTVRLSLAQHPEEGFFLSPVIDLAKTQKDPLGLRGGCARRFSVSIEADTPAGTSVTLLARTGDTPHPAEDAWTDFLTPEDAALAGRRYLQWKAVLRTENPAQTPVLKRVTVEAEMSREPEPKWAERLFLNGYRIERIRSTSIPFSYEDPSHPRLKALREKYKLDGVVAQGKTELEKLVLLRDWVARQWNWKPPEGHYPAWDAEEILSRPDGMCVQFAITLIQCYLAMGWQARFVYGEHSGTMKTGHEVVEVWSNEYRKWIFMDPTSSQNEFCADPRTGEPLSMREIHDRMVSHYYPGSGEIRETDRPSAGRWCGTIAEARGRTTTPNRRLDGSDPAPADWPSWTKWFRLWFIPRNDWYSRPRPLPRCQGWNNWDWVDSWVWHDQRIPRLRNYRNFTNRRSDIEWTINQVVCGLTYGRKQKTLEVTLATLTPHFDTFLVRTDGGRWKKTGPRVVWTLHSGTNRLEMRARNKAGVCGPVSFVEVEI